eukprot:6213930-Pleurochrysis_carterae.AAC.2
MERPEFTVEACTDTLRLDRSPIYRYYVRMLPHTFNSTRSGTSWYNTEKSSARAAIARAVLRRARRVRGGGGAVRGGGGGGGHVRAGRRRGAAGGGVGILAGWITAWISYEAAGS